MSGVDAAGVLAMRTFQRYWPDGTYCPEGREHVSWVTIHTTAEDIECFGTEGPITPCPCGTYGWIAALLAAAPATPTPPAPPSADTGGRP